MEDSDFSLPIKPFQILLFGYRNTSKGVIRKVEDGHYHAKYSKEKGLMFIHFDYYGYRSHLNFKNSIKLLPEKIRLKKCLLRYKKRQKRKVVIYFKRDDSPVLYKKLSKKQKKSGLYKEVIYFEHDSE